MTQSTAEALSWVASSAEDGYALAQFELAKRYFEGQDVPLDVEMGTQLVTKAAVQGLADAQFHLGMSAGLGQHAAIAKSVQMEVHTFEDYLLDHAATEAAAKWFAKAARQGHSGAQKALSGALELIRLRRQPASIRLRRQRERHNATRKDDPQVG